MNVQNFIKKNGSTILTCLGGVGVVATSVMAVKATPKALQLIEEAKEEKGENLSKWETIQVAAPSYIPAILTGTATIACIFGANLLNKHQQASLMSAYALIDQLFKDYKAKVADLYGEDADIEIRAELAKDEYEEHEDEYEDGKTLYYDEYSKRYFRATKEDVLRAEYEINKILNSDECACLNTFYQLLGLKKVDYGEYVGWSCGQMFDMYWSSWVDFWHEEVEMEDGMECTILRFTGPFVDFEDY